MEDTGDKLTKQSNYQSKLIKQKMTILKVMLASTCTKNRNLHLIHCFNIVCPKLGQPIFTQKLLIIILFSLMLPSGNVTVSFTLYCPLV